MTTITILFIIYFENYSVFTPNAQVPRYLVTCDGEIGGYRANALYRENVVNVAKQYILFFLQSIIYRKVPSNEAKIANIHFI